MKRPLGRWISLCAAGMGLMAFFLLARTLGRKEGQSQSQGLLEVQEALARPAVSAETIIAGWPATAQAAAKAMLAKYGKPDEFSADSLVWRDNGPWKRTVVHREAWLDRFYTRRADVLQQAIAYRVPPERLADLASFDARLVADRSGNELSFRSESERRNFLALNLAYDIIAREKTADEARLFYRKAAGPSQAGWSSPYTEGFIFPVAARSRADSSAP